MTKKVQQYCEVIQPPMVMGEIDKLKDILSVTRESKTFVFFGTEPDGSLNFLREDGSQNIRYFECAIDAVNYLSKKEGWHLVKTYACAFASGCGDRTYNHWIMAREVEVDE